MPKVYKDLFGVWTIDYSNVPKKEVETVTEVSVHAKQGSLELNEKIVARPQLAF